MDQAQMSVIFGWQAATDAGPIIVSWGLKNPKPMILQTDRLALRRFTVQDAPFMFRLVNEPSWLQYIGDRQVRSVADAEKYLLEGAIRSYAEHGFGFYLVTLKESAEPIGVCGFAKRPFLDTPDFGLAFLPEYTGIGYAHEISAHTLQYGHEVLGLDRILAYTTPANQRSITLLTRLGFRFDKPIQVDGEELMLFELVRMNL